MSTTHKWRPGLFYIIAGMALILPERAMAVCFGDSEVVSEYLFSEGSGTTVINTGIDEDDGNAALREGAVFSSDVPPPNMNCGWSVCFPSMGSGANTPAVETDAVYDPLAGADRFTILAWVRRESGSDGSNTSARIVSDTSSLALTNTTAGAEFRFGGSSGSLYLRVNGSEVGTTAASIPPDSAAWRHVAVVYDGARPATNYLTRNVHFYVDGVQCGHGNVLEGAVVGANESRLTVGNSAVSRGVGNLLAGKLDDVMILYGVAPDAVGNGNTNEVIRCYMEFNDDIVPPLLIPPPPVSGIADPGQCSSTTIDLGEPTVSDDCNVASVAHNAPAALPVGTNQVVWTATDMAGNRVSATQTVTVADMEAPVFVGVSNITVDAGICLTSVTNVVLEEPMVTDNCGVVSMYSTAPAVLSIGTHVAVWHAWDAAGNHATATQEVWVVPSRVADCDGDGLTDFEEVHVYGTDPENPSSANDGISDGWKVQYGFDPAVPIPTECRPTYW